LILECSPRQPPASRTSALAYLRLLETLSKGLPPTLLVCNPLSHGVISTEV